MFKDTPERVKAERSLEKEGHLGLGTYAPRTLALGTCALGTLALETL